MFSPVQPARTLMKPAATLCRGLILLSMFAALVQPVASEARGLAPPVAGLTTDWSAAETPYFRFHVQSPDSALANDVATAFGGYAETALAELTLLLELPALSERIAVYAYTDFAAYQAATLAVTRPEIETVAVLGDGATRDMTLYLPDVQELSPLEAENAFRHAIAHIATAVASGGNVPWGFDEGIAQYVERPVTEKQARIAGIVKSAYQSEDNISWSDMNRTNSPVSRTVASAQAYAVVAFLIDRYEITALRRFLTELAVQPEWRSAMQTAYSRKPEDLERQWREDLPRWSNGAWRENLVAAFDLAPAEKLLAGANYAAAKEALEPSLTLFRQLDDPERLAYVESLITQCDVGIQAESLMTQAQQALELHTYDRAANLLAQARLQFEQLPLDQQPVELLATYESLAVSGIQATEQLDQAVQLSHSWRDYPDARDAAKSAGTTFATLGDAESLARAQDVLDDLDDRQRRIVLLLGALAVLTLAWLALWLWARGPSELDWS